MDLRPDPLQAQLRRALRAGLGGVTARPGTAGDPVDDGPASPAKPVLDELGAHLYELPSAVGGMELGLMAGVTVSEELGRAAAGNPHRAVALTADAAMATVQHDLIERLLDGVTVAAAGLEAVPPGSGVSARPSDGGWELTGTVIADAAEADLLAVACRPGGQPALALMPSDAPGRKPLGGWPSLIELAGVTVTDADLLRDLTRPLARARVRQAAYLYGLAAGMLEAAIGYAGRRRQFGTRLRDLQAVSFPLARAVVTLRAARMGIYHAAWLLDSPTAARGVPGDPPAEALAASAEALADVARSTMQACGVRAMTPELPLHRYYRLAAAESIRYGRPAALWRAAGAAYLRSQTASGCSSGCISPDR